jgi:hypothetical protein
MSGWFTEGLDTADLQQARTLLEQLAYRPPQSTRGAMRCHWNACLAKQVS